MSARATGGTTTGRGATAAQLVPTPSQTIGPFLSMGMEPLERRDVVQPGTPGAFTLCGTVRDEDDAPVPDAVLELWQPGPDGRFTTGAGAGGDEAWFGRSLTGPDGGYTFTTARPAPVALRTGEPQAPHIELLIFARGLLRPVRTRVYFPDEPANETDPVLLGIAPKRRSTLVATAIDGGFVFDVKLRGAGETVFFAC